MLAPPLDQIERERARVSESAQQIYEDTRIAVEDEIARMEAVEEWAGREMEAATERAKRRLAKGEDADAVKRDFDVELKGVMKQGMDPSFDPRPPVSVKRAEQRLSSSEHSVRAPPAAILMHPRRTPRALPTPQGKLGTRGA